MIFFFLPPSSCAGVLGSQGESPILVSSRKRNKLFILKTHADGDWKSIFSLSSSLCLHGLLFLAPPRIFTYSLHPQIFLIISTFSLAWHSFRSHINKANWKILVSNSQPHTQVPPFKPSHKSHKSSDSLRISYASISSKPWSDQPVVEEGVGLRKQSL